MQRSLQPWLCAALLFAAALLLFTRENRFPFFYHPDEPAKVEQVQTAEWNYHHPMLMLGTARAAMEISGSLEPDGSGSPQRIVEIGRSVSAAFCAGSVVLLAMMVWLSAGRFAGIAAGLLLLTNQQLFELSHYFKEDTSLLFGVSAWFFALALYWKRPHWSTAALVGIGSALAVSGKYIGAFAPLLSLWLVPYRAGAGKRGRAFVAFAGTLATVFALVNLPILLHLANFQEGFNREVQLVVKGQRGMTRSVPSDVYLTAFRENLFYFLWVGIAWHYVSCWLRRRELTALEWVIALFPAVFLVVLSFSPKTNDRYFLPATALFLCLAAIGFDRLRTHWPARWRWPAPAIAALALGLPVVTQLPGLFEYYRAFGRDDLVELTAWLNANLPDATLAVDRKVMLPTPKYRKYHDYQPPVRAAIVPKTIESFPDVDGLRAAGVTHVVLSESAYGRYRLDSLHPQPGAKESYDKNVNLYRALQTGKKLWGDGYERGTVTYLHPGLEVYALLPAKPPSR